MIAGYGAGDRDTAYNTLSFIPRGNVTVSYGLNWGDGVCTSYDTTGVPYMSADAAVGVRLRPVGPAGDEADGPGPAESG
jgi:hypothetical protein